MNGEQVEIQKQAIVACFKKGLLPHRLPGDTEKNHENPVIKVFSPAKNRTEYLPNTSLEFSFSVTYLGYVSSGTKSSVFTSEGNVVSVSKHYDIQAYRGVEINLLKLQTSVLHGGEQPV